MENFQRIPIQRYTKTQLALMYEVHYNTLRNWICENYELLDKLAKIDYQHTRKFFRKCEVKLIFRHLGEPNLSLNEVFLRKK